MGKGHPRRVPRRELAALARAAGGGRSMQIRRTIAHRARHSGGADRDAPRTPRSSSALVAEQHLGRRRSAVHGGDPVDRRRPRRPARAIQTARGQPVFWMNPGTGEVCYDYTVSGVATLGAAHIQSSRRSASPVRSSIPLEPTTSRRRHRLRDRRSRPDRCHPHERRAPTTSTSDNATLPPPAPCAASSGRTPLITSTTRRPQAASTILSSAASCA